MLKLRLSAISRSIPVLILVLFLNIPAMAKYSGGTGEPNNPYQIADANDWVQLINTSADWNKNFIMTADIDVNGLSLTPVGIYSTYPFTGIFNGGGHIIYNADVNMPNNEYVGLFGCVGSSGQIRNLDATNVKITGKNYVGGIVGYNGIGTLSNCYSSGTVSGNEKVGGLVGYNISGLLTNCNSNSTVSGQSYLIGGLVGSNDYGSISNCYSTGTVMSNGSYVGGLVGGNRGTSNSGSINNCYSTGAVNGKGYTGGLVGCNVVAKVTNSYSTGIINGDYWVGGFAGSNRGILGNCYSTGIVIGKGDVGGVEGYSNGNMTNCYNAGMVSGEEYVGGLVGYNYDTVTNCYSTGKINGNKNIGGLVGFCELGGQVSNCIWDIETSGLLGSSGGVGLTTSQMMDPNMLGLNGFSNNPNWVLNAGKDYPRLTWQGTQGEMIPEPDIDLFEGKGTKEEPYLIATDEQLIMLGKASILCHKNFTLCNDIDLDPNLFNIQAFNQAIIPSFSGIFDGNDHTISNLVIEGSSCLGLFGRLESGAEVKNLGIKDVNILGSDDYVGELVGINCGDIIHCYSTGTAKGKDDVGGLVGVNYVGTMSNNNSTGLVSGEEYVGGLVGLNLGGILTNCCSAGTASGNEEVGGLVGENSYIIANCYSTNSVTSYRYVGGLVGYNWGNVTYCYSTGKVSGDYDVGGLVGYHSNGLNRTITRSFWNIQTSGQATSGGGTGKTTAQMRTRSTFTNYGWDFVGETVNGSNDIWWILNGKDYPKLWWQLPVDDFNDCKATPLWLAYQLTPDMAYLTEINSRLEVNNVGSPAYTEALYISDGWRLDANKPFAFRIDFHFSKLGSGRGKVILGMGPNFADPNAQWAQFEAGSVNDYPYYSYVVTDGNWADVQVWNRLVNDGTMYISYDPNSDKLYFSNRGYGAGNAAWTVAGLIRGRWHCKSLCFTLGGGSQAIVLTGKDAWLDNFRVDEGAIFQ